jgi:hypothetical protein
MRRKRILFWGGLACLVLGGGIGVLLVLLHHEPAFYNRAHMPPGKERRDASMQFMARLYEVYDHFKDEGDYAKKIKQWNHIFTAEQINCFLAEDFVRGNLGDALERKGISAPRVAIDGDRLRLAFRYGNDWWSTVVSLDLRVWLVPKEINVVALEIVGRRAGAVPISAQFFLDQIMDIGKRHNVDVTLYRHEGNPVALMRFQSDRMKPAAQLRRLELRPGTITICGAPLEQQVLGEATGQSLHIE